MQAQQVQPEPEQIQPQSPAPTEDGGGIGASLGSAWDAIKSGAQHLGPMITNAAKAGVRGAMTSGYRTIGQPLDVAGMAIADRLGLEGLSDTFSRGYYNAGRKAQEWENNPNFKTAPLFNEQGKVTPEGVAATGGGLVGAMAPIAVTIAATQGMGASALGGLAGMAPEASAVAQALAAGSNFLRTGGQLAQGANLGSRIAARVGANVLPAVPFNALQATRPETSLLGLLHEQAPEIAQKIPLDPQNFWHRLAGEEVADLGLTGLLEGALHTPESLKVLKATGRDIRVRRGMGKTLEELKNTPEAGAIDEALARAEAEVAGNATPPRPEAVEAPVRPDQPEAAVLPEPPVDRAPEAAPAAQEPIPHISEITGVPEPVGEAVVGPAIPRTPKRVRPPKAQPGALTPEQIQALARGEEIDLGAGPFRVVQEPGAEGAGALKAMADPEASAESMARQEALQVEREQAKQRLSAPAKAVDETPAVDPFEELAKRDDIVEVPPMGAGQGGSTVNAVKTAIEKVGRDKFRKLVEAEILRRGGRKVPEVEMAATETVARRLASEGVEIRQPPVLGQKPAPEPEPVAAPVKKPRGKMARMEAAGQGKLLAAGGLEVGGAALQDPDDPTSTKSRIGQGMMIAGVGGLATKEGLKAAGEGLRRIVGAEGIPMVRGTESTRNIVRRAVIEKPVMPEGLDAAGRRAWKKSLESETTVGARNLMEATAAERLGKSSRVASEELELPLVKKKNGTMAPPNKRVTAVKDNLYNASHDEKVSRVVELGEKEAKEAMLVPEVGEAAVWYREAIVEMEKELRRIFPELKDPDKMAFFKVLAAMTSPNNAPVPNIKQASQIYRRWRFGAAQGEPELSALAGGVLRTTSSKDIDKKLQFLQGKLAEYVEQAGGDEKLGLKALISDMLNREVIVTKGGKKGPARVLRGIKDYLAKGPDSRKTPNFWLNLMEQSGFVTGDVWATRTLRRHLGYLVEDAKRVPTGEFDAAGKEIYRTDPSKLAINGIPTNPEYNVIEDGFSEIANRLNADPKVRAQIRALSKGKRDRMDPMDVQALLWYYEKDLYSRVGVVDSGKEGFNDAARLLHQQYKAGEELGFADEAANDLKLPEVRLGKKGQPLSVDRKARAGQVKRMLEDTPKEADRRFARLASEQGWSNDRIKLATKDEKMQMLINSKYGAASQELLGGLAGAGAGALAGDENDSTGERLGKVALGAAAGAGLAAGAKRLVGGAEKAGAKTIDADAAAKAIEEAEPKGAKTAYEKASLKGTIGTAKESEPRLTPAILRADPTGQEWALEQARLRYRRKITDKEVAEASKLVDTDALTKGRRMASNSADLEALAQSAVILKNRAVKAAEKVSSLGDPASLVGAEKEAYHAALNEEAWANKEVIATLNAMQPGLSEAGRMLRYARFMANNVDEPAFWVRQFKGVMGIPMNVDLPKKMGDELANILTKRDAKGKLTHDAKVELMALWNQHVQPSSALRRTMQTIKASLLFAVATWAANDLSNMAKLGVDYTVAKPAAALFDKLASAVAGTERSTTYSSDVLKAGLKGAKDEVTSIFAPAARAYSTGKQKGGRVEGVKEFISRLRKEIAHVGDENILKKLDAMTVHHNPDTRWGRFEKGLWDLSFGMLDKQDRVNRGFYRGATKRELAEAAATRAAKAKGFKKGSAEWDEEVRSFIAGESPESKKWQDTIQREEDMGVFTEENSLADGLNALVRKAPYLEPLFLFRRAPSNIIKQTTVDYTPLGIGKALWLDELKGKGVLQKGLSDEALQARYQMMQQLGRTSAGAALLFGGAYLFDKKFLEAQPTSRDEQTNQQASNVMGGSLRVGGDRTLNVNRYGPVGMLLLLGADIKKALDSDEDALDKASRIASSPFKAARELPMVKGSNTLADWTNPNDFERSSLSKLTGNLGGMLIPGAAGAVARATDPVARHELDGPLDEMKNRIPGLRRTLPPKATPLGRVEEGRGWLTETFVPGLSKEFAGPVEKAVRKYNLAPSKLPKLKDETDKEYYRRLKAITPTVLQEMSEFVSSDDDFLQADPEEKRKLFRAKLSAARKAATNEYLNP